MSCLTSPPTWVLLPQADGANCSLVWAFTFIDKHKKITNGLASSQVLLLNNLKKANNYYLNATIHGLE